MLQLPAGREASRGECAPQYESHRPEQPLLYQLIEEYYPAFEAQWATGGRVLPDYVRQEFDEYLKCGRLEHGFLRVQCDTCHAEHLVAFSCKRRGFCPSCGARRMAESAALLVDEVLPHAPMGTQRAVSSQVPVCQPTQNHGQGAEYRLPYHCDAPDPESGLYEINCSCRCGYPDSAFRRRAEPECSFSYAVPRWCLRG